MVIRVADQPDSGARIWDFKTDVIAVYEDPIPLTISATSDFGEFLTISFVEQINKQTGEEVVVEITTTHNFDVDINGEIVIISGSTLNEVGSKVIEFIV